jgi:hypothetical protein
MLLPVVNGRMPSLLFTNLTLVDLLHEASEYLKAHSEISVVSVESIIEEDHIYLILRIMP